MAAGQRPAWLHAAWAFCPSHSALGTTAKGINQLRIPLGLVGIYALHGHVINLPVVPGVQVIASLSALACSQGPWEQLHEWIYNVCAGCCKRAEACWRLSVPLERRRPSRREGLMLWQC